MKFRILLGIKFIIRHLIVTSKIKLRLLFFYKQRNLVKNYLKLYILTSSFVVRIFSRIFLSFIDINRFALEVNYNNNFTLRFPFFSYLLNYEDLFSTYEKYYFNDYEKLYNKKFLVKEGSTILDIGAHIGTFSVPLAYKNNVKIFCLEPDPINFSFLKKNIQINNLEKKIIPLKKALYFNNDSVNFNIGDATTRGNIAEIGFYKAKTNPNVIEVETISIDKLVAENNIDNIDILKIDCEGSEFFFIKSFSDEIFKKISNIFIEIHPLDDESKNPLDLIDFIKSKGFTVKYNFLENGCYECYFKKSIIWKF